MEEIWKKTLYCERYSVSNFGNVRNDNTRRILRPEPDHDGYQVVLFSVDSVRKIQKIHRLVAEAFCDKPEGCDIVDHIDHNVTNNHFSNLRWVTISVNCKNKKKRKGCTSQYIGVSFNKLKKSKPWRAGISINKKSRRIGDFDSEEEAHEAWRQVVIENNLQDHYPEFFKV